MIDTEPTPIAIGEGFTCRMLAEKGFEIDLNRVKVIFSSQPQIVCSDVITVHVGRTNRRKPIKVVSCKRTIDFDEKGCIQRRSSEL